MKAGSIELGSGGIVRGESDRVIFENESSGKFAINYRGEIYKI